MYQPGSSPLARGARARSQGVRQVLGIIPACAGSTRRSRPTARWPWDHPRLRGEHAAYGQTDVPFSGSSPLARGALIAPVAVALKRGIIPACAGSTDTKIYQDPMGEDHPRLRGEHRWVRRYTKPGEGSSPLARGAHVEGGRAGAVGGIIPACAGSTWARELRRALKRDHPRLRGEHT